MGVSSEPDLEAEIAAVVAAAAAVEMAGTGVVADAGSRASHSASCHSAVAAGAAGGDVVGDDESGGATEPADVGVVVRTAAGDAEMV